MKSHLDSNLPGFLPCDSRVPLSLALVFWEAVDHFIPVWLHLFICALKSVDVLCHYCCRRVTAVDRLIDQFDWWKRSQQCVCRARNDRFHRRPSTSLWLMLLLPWRSGVGFLCLLGWVLTHDDPSQTVQSKSCSSSIISLCHNLSKLAAPNWELAMKVQYQQCYEFHLGVSGSLSAFCCFDVDGVFFFPVRLLSDLSTKLRCRCFSNSSNIVVAQAHNCNSVFQHLLCQQLVDIWSDTFVCLSAIYLDMSFWYVNRFLIPKFP